MLTTEALIESISALTYPSRPDKRTRVATEEYLLATKTYREDERALRDQWQAWLVSEYLPFNTPRKVTEKMFAMAWERGHSEGYRRVENEFEELADLVTLAIQED